MSFQRGLHRLSSYKTDWQACRFFILSFLLTEAPVLNSPNHRSLLSVLLLMMGLFVLPLSGSTSAQAQWSPESQSDRFLPVDEAFQVSAWHDGETLSVGFKAAEGYYLYRHQFGVESGLAEIRLGEQTLPPGTFTSDEFLGDVYIFRDQVKLDVVLDTALQGPLPIKVRYQGCADAGLCYPPEEIETSAAMSGPPSAFVDTEQTADNAAASALDEAVSPRPTMAENGPDAFARDDRQFASLLENTRLPLALGLFFVAGLGLTFTPCVLPMIPILSSIVIGQNPGRRRAALLSLSYVLGMSLTYAGVGVLMGLFGAGLNLQARLQSAPVLITFSLLFVVFALGMFGAFNLRLAPGIAGRVERLQEKAQQSGPLGLALAGALSVLVVSPCVTAPLAGALVFISSTGNALIGGSVLFALGLGMGVPLLLVGTFGNALLPRAGAWMNGVKTAFGILLLAIAVWMIERLLAPSLSLLLWALLCLGSGLALGALSSGQRRGWAQARQALGILLLIWGVALAWGAAQGSGDPLRPLQVSGSEGQRQSTALADFTTVNSLAALDQQLLLAQQAAKPVFVHFSADWCVSCKLMERRVYPDPDVARELDAFQLIKADVTENDAKSRALLNRFDLFGPPGLVFFKDDKEIRGARILGEINAPALAAHLESLRDWLARY